MATGHPTYKEMTITAISNLNERHGSSRQAIAKYVASRWDVTEKYEMYVKQALKKLTKQRVITQTKGTGVTGSFRLNPVSKVLQSKESKSAVEEPETGAAAVSEEDESSEEEKSAAVKKLKFDGGGKKSAKAGEGAAAGDENQDSGDLEAKETAPKNKGRNKKKSKQK